MDRQALQEPVTSKRQWRAQGKENRCSNGNLLNAANNIGALHTPKTATRAVLSQIAKVCGFVFGACMFFVLVVLYKKTKASEITR